MVATLLGAVAASGMQFSTAAFTATSAAPLTVTAANDWTPPTVAMTDPGSPLSGVAGHGDARAARCRGPRRRWWPASTVAVLTTVVVTTDEIAE